MFRHPKYYKELRKRNKSDQVISANKLDGDMKVRAPGPGLKRQASSHKPQAPSVKPQASSAKLLKQQATSVKPCSQRLKLQAKIIKSSDPGSWKKFHGA